jgi:hypothetical protein
MKKILLLTLTALVVSASAFAHDFRPRGQNGIPRQAFSPADKSGEELTLNGRLEWINGRIAVRTEDKTYFVSGIRQLLGFVDGLKEGAELTLTGRAYGVSHIPEYHFFRTEKVGFNGKEYTLNQGGPGFGGVMWGRHDGGMMRHGRRAG